MRAPRAQSLCLAQFYPTQGPTNRAGQSILQGFILSRLVRVSYQKDREREWACYSYRNKVSLAWHSESICKTTLNSKILSKLQMLLRVIVGRRCDTDQLHQLIITLGQIQSFLFHKKTSAQLYGSFCLIASKRRFQRFFQVLRLEVRRKFVNNLIFTRYIIDFNEYVRIYYYAFFLQTNMLIRKGQP